MTKQKSSARFRFSGVMLFLALFFFLVPALQAGDYRLAVPSLPGLSPWTG